MRDAPVSQRTRRVIGAVALACALAASGAQALSLGGFKNSLVGFLLQKISVPGQFEVGADRIESPSDGSTVLRGLHIRDSRGVWLRAERLAFSWSPSRLLKGEVQIDSVELVRAHLDRLPEVVPDPDQPPAPESRPGWPRSPITIHAPSISIREMSVSDRVAPQAIRFDARGALRDEGNEQSLMLEVKRVDAVAGNIALTYLKRFDNDRLELALNAREAPGGLVAAAAGLPSDVSASLDLEGAGTPSEWRGRLGLDVPDMVAANGALNAAWLSRLGLDLEVSVRPGRRLPEAPRLAIGEEATLRVVLEESPEGIVRIEQGRLEALALRADARGTYDRTAAVLDLALDLDVDTEGARRLAALTAPLRFERAHLGISARGPAAAPVFAGGGELLRPSGAGFSAAAATLEFELPTADGSTATLALTAESPRGPDPEYARVLGSRLRVAATTRREGERLVIERAAIESAAIDAGARGVVTLSEPPSIDLAYSVTAPDLAPLAALAAIDARGRLRASGTAKGDVADVRTAGEAELADAVVNAQRLGHVALRHDTRVTDRIEGSARLVLDSPDFGRGSASTSYRFANGSIALDRLVLNLLAIEARGNVRLAPGARVPTGQLAFTVASLEPLGRLAGRRLEGRGEGRAVLAPGAGGQSEVRANLESLRVDELTLSELVLDGSAEGLAHARPRLRGVLAARGLARGDLRLEETTLRADGPLDALAVELESSGSHAERALALATRLEAALGKPAQEFRIHAFEARYADETVSLAAPAVLRTAPGTLDVEDLDLALPDDGRLAGAVAWRPDAATVDLEIERLALRLLDLVAETPVSRGQVSGRIRAHTGRAAPRLEARLDAAGLHLDGVPAAIGDLSARVVAGWDGEFLSGDLAVSGPFDPSIEGRFALPVRATAAALPDVAANGPFAATLDWTGKVEPLVALLPLSNHVVSGHATIALRVGGTLSAPVAAGELALDDGRYENLVAGTIVEGVTVRSDFTEIGRIGIVLTGTDGVGGELRVEGTVRPGTPDELLDITARATRMLLVRIDAATARSSATLSVKSSAATTTVKGEVEIERAEIRLQNPLPPSIVELGEVRIEGQPEPPEASEEDDASRVVLDIGVTMPGQVFVRGRGLESEWGGALKIAGTASAPEIDGRIESLRGDLDLLGRVFELERGRIVFRGGKDSDPNLDLRFLRESNELTGRILVEGTGSRPVLRFTSSPALPEGEVLPRLLFGRSRQSLSGPEALQLAAGLAALAQGGESVVDKTRKALGVDVLRIESDGEGADASSSLNVGRYATENVYVGAKQALDGRSTAVVVEIELPRNFVVDTEIGQDADTSVGITWRRNF